MRKIEDLVAFVKAQPKDRKINHLSWHLCAVGDWWHNDSPAEERDPNSWIEITEWLEVEAHNWWVKIGCQAGFKEYGDVAKYMKSTQPIKQKRRTSR